MRLTVEVLAGCRVWLNPLLQRELDLRGYKIPEIENLGACRDQVDAINLVDNEIEVLGNFPKLKRVRVLLMCNNRISRIEGQNIGKALPNVETVNLASNRLALLSEIDELAGLTSLSTLILVDNPVTLRKHYRLYAIHKLPSLKHLDFKKIKPNERELAARLFASGDGKRVVRAVADMAALQLKKKRRAAKF